MHRLTRRSLLGLLPAAGVALAKITPRRVPQLPKVGEFVRFADPTTETTVVRLTRTDSASVLPASQNRFVSSKSRFMLFSSDRTGKFAPFQVDLRTGVLRQLAETEKLATGSLSMDARERALYLIDGSALKEISLPGGKERTVIEGAASFSLGNDPGELILLKGGDLIRIENGREVKLAGEVNRCGPVRPNGTGCVFVREMPGSATPNREFWYAPFAPGSKPLMLAQGSISNPSWSPDSAALLFLRDVKTDSALLSELHAISPEETSEIRVAPTSQFAAFSTNADGSVFVGASRSKAQPNIVLMLRKGLREFTLCEHHSTNPASVAPVFSPNSQRVYFQSDHEGKPAIYSVNVELLIEPTL